MRLPQAGAAWFLEIDPVRDMCVSALEAINNQWCDMNSI